MAEVSPLARPVAGFSTRCIAMTTQDEREDQSADAGARPARKGKRLAGRLAIGPDYVFDYKDPQTLKYFVTERGRIAPQRISGLSSRQQRQLAQAIKRARQIALLPFTGSELLSSGASPD